MRLQHPDQRCNSFRRQSVGILLGPRLLQRLRNPLLVEGLQKIIDGIYFESLHRILIKRRGEDNFGERNFLVEQLLDDPEAVEARHLNVQKNQVGIVLFDEVDRLETVLALGNDIDVAGVFQQISEFVAGEFLIVHDNRG